MEFNIFLFFGTTWIVNHIFFTQTDFERTYLRLWFLGTLKEDGEGNDLLEMYLAACARDAGKEVAAFGPADVLAVLKQKRGRRSPYFQVFNVFKTILSSSREHESSQNLQPIQEGKYLDLYIPIFCLRGHQVL